MAKLENPVYAVVNATTNYGFGHIDVHVYELFNNTNCTLRITCQAGGHQKVATYAWKNGLSNDFDVLELSVMKRGTQLLRKIANGLYGAAAEVGNPQDFAEYALRILQILRVPAVYVNAPVDKRYSGSYESLPKFHPVKDMDGLLTLLKSMEAAILRKV